MHVRACSVCVCVCVRALASMCVLLAEQNPTHLEFQFISSLLFRAIKEETAKVSANYVE